MLNNRNLSELDDQQLVAEYLRGNQAAFEFLVQRHLSPIYNFVFKYVHTVSDAEDVTQEAFVKIWKNLKKFDKNKKFKTWAFTIAKNTALDLLRRKGLVPFSQLDSAGSVSGSEIDYDFAASLVSRAPLPEARVEQIERLEMIGHAVARLPEKQQQVVDLYYKQGFNFREISEILKESINTVKTRHRRAMLFLKRHLEDE